MGGFVIKKEDVRLNEEIRVPEVRLIDPEGKQIGIVPIEKALEMAETFDQDLVEIAPDRVENIEEVERLLKKLQGEDEEE